MVDSEMDRDLFHLGFLEEVIGRDRSFASSLVSFVAILVILINQVFVSSIFVGGVASVVFFVINIVLLGRGFFAAESPLNRFLLSGLVLLAFLGLVGWMVMIVNGLDVWMVTLVLFVVAVGCSLSNRFARRRVRRGVS